MLLVCKLVQIIVITATKEDAARGGRALNYTDINSFCGNRHLCIKQGDFKSTSGLWRRRNTQKQNLGGCSNGKHIVDGINKNASLRLHKLHTGDVMGLSIVVFDRVAVSLLASSPSLRIPFRSPSRIIPHEESVIDRHPGVPYLAKQSHYCVAFCLVVLFKNLVGDLVELRPVEWCPGMGRRELVIGGLTLYCSLANFLLVPFVQLTRDKSIELRILFFLLKELVDG